MMNCCLMRQQGSKLLFRLNLCLRRSNNRQQIAQHFSSSHIVEEQCIPEDQGWTIWHVITRLNRANCSNAPPAVGERSCCPQHTVRMLAGDHCVNRDIWTWTCKHVVISLNVTRSLLHSAMQGSPDATSQVDTSNRGNAPNS